MFYEAVCHIENARFLLREINNLRRHAFFAFRLDGGCAIGERFLDERNDVGLGLVLVALRIFCCRRLLPHDGIGEEIVCSCRMQQLLCEAALRRRGLEVVFVLRKILGHGDEFAANLVPGIQHDLQFGVGSLTAASFFIASWAWAGNANASRTIARNGILFISFSTIEFRESKLQLLISPASAPQQPQQVYRVSGSSPLIDRYFSRSPWVHFQ